MNNVSKEKGDKFESIVEKIYIQIANNERIKAKVEKHVPIIGGIIELVYIVLQSVVKPGITGFFKIDLHIKCYIYLS